MRCTAAIIFALAVPSLAQQCGSDDDAPVCSPDEDCCKDSPTCTGVCTECCVRQSTFCVAPRSGFVTSTCCSRWTVGCSVGSVGCCDPAQPWQFVGSSVSEARTSRRAADRAGAPVWAKRLPSRQRPPVVAVDHTAEGEDVPLQIAPGGLVAYALFPQLFLSSLNIFTIDPATGNTSKATVKGPAASYVARLYGESGRVFPFDPKAGGRFVFADIDLTAKGAKPSAASPLTLYAIAPDGASTSQEVTGCAGYPYGLRWDEVADHLVVGLQTETKVQICGIKDDGTATTLASVDRTKEESAAFYAAFLSHVHDGVAYRVGHEVVSLGTNPGFSTTQLSAAGRVGGDSDDDDDDVSTATTTWNALPTEPAHGLPSTIRVHPSGKGYVSLAPRSSADGGFDAVAWDDAANTTEVVGQFANAHMPSLAGMGAQGSLGYVGEGLAGNTFAAMTVALDSAVPLGLGDKWTLSTVDLETGTVAEMALAPPPSVEGAETVSLSGFGITTAV